MTGSTSRKPRLVGGDKGCNVSIVSFPGSPALWAGSFTKPEDILFLPKEMPEHNSDLRENAAGRVDTYINKRGTSCGNK